MRLEQLRFVREIVRHNLIISDAAEALHVAQPGISKQVHLLEEELGVVIFARNRSRLISLTDAGKRVLAIAERILNEVNHLRQVGTESGRSESGPLTVATTHTQALHALPGVIQRYMKGHPAVRLRVHQGTPAQIWHLLSVGEADIAVSSGPKAIPSSIALFKCGDLQRIVLTLPNHPLLQKNRITLEQLSRYPLITYDDEFIGRSQVHAAFEAHGLVPNFVLSATDSDVMKAYVGLGLGVAIVASLAFDPARDKHLRAITASHLFKPNSVYVGVRRGQPLSRYALDFIGMVAPAVESEAAIAAQQPRIRCISNIAKACWENAQTAKIPAGSARATPVS